MTAERPSLGRLALTFFKVGITSFGGPIVALGLIHFEAVERHRWVTPHWFSSTVGLLEAVPGPTATEMSISVGVALRGRLGGLVAGLAYVLPGFFIILALSAVYFRFGELPWMSAGVEGLKPGAMAVLALVCWKLARSTVRDRVDAVILAASMVLCLLGASIALVILAFGLVRLAWEKRSPSALASFLPAALLFPSGSDISRAPSLFLGMLKAGALVTGGGYVIASFMSQDFVTARGWLTREEFLAGLAIAQFKPGPIILLSVFIGYKAAGAAGALLSALAVFLPCFSILLAVGPHIERVRGGPRLSVFLRGMAAASIGSIIAVAIQLLPPAVGSAAQAAVFAAALAALTKLDPAWVMAASALAGLWVVR